MREGSFKLRLDFSGEFQTGINYFKSALTGSYPYFKLQHSNMPQYYGIYSRIKRAVSASMRLMPFGYNYGKSP